MTLPTLFISYRTRDAVFAGRIYDALKPRFGEERIFFDQRSIRAGSKWDAEIDRSLAECGAFLLVITPRWLASFAEREADGGRDYHRREIELALRRSIPMIQLVIDDAAPPSAATLPEGLDHLAHLPWERARNDRTFDEAMHRLGDQIDEILGRPLPTPPAPAPPAPPARPAPPAPGAQIAEPNAGTPAPIVGHGVGWTAPAAPRSASPEEQLASRRWRLLHAIWPWAVFSFGYLAWVGFGYAGLRARRRSWVLFGVGYLAVYAAVLIATGVAGPRVEGKSTVVQDAAAAVAFVMWIVSSVHLVVVNRSWLRWRSTAPRSGVSAPV